MVPGTLLGLSTVDAPVTFPIVNQPGTGVNEGGGVGLLVVGCWLLVVGCWLLVVGCWLLVVGCWLLVVGCWLLVAGCWLLVAGCWLLVAGCWLLVAGSHPVNPVSLRPPASRLPPPASRLPPPASGLSPIAYRLYSPQTCLASGRAVRYPPPPNRHGLRGGTFKRPINGVVMSLLIHTQDAGNLTRRVSSRAGLFDRLCGALPAGLRRWSED